MKARLFRTLAAPKLGSLQSTRVVCSTSLLTATTPTAFTGLRRFVLASLDGEAQPARALLVNLNLRAITAGGADSLVERQLVAMLKDAAVGTVLQLRPRRDVPDQVQRRLAPRPVVWAGGSRAGSPICSSCFTSAGSAHVTMRDLRSALSFMLLRDHSCDDVGRLVSREDAQVTEDLARLYYPNAFADLGQSALKRRSSPSRRSQRRERSTGSFDGCARSTSASSIHRFSTGGSTTTRRVPFRG